MHTHPGFTLIELLVVITILGVLVGLLLPAAGLVKQQAGVAKCRSSQKQIFMAAQGYAQDDSGRLPDVQLANAGSGLPMYWMLLLHDYLEQSGAGTFQLSSYSRSNVFQSCPAIPKDATGSAFALNNKLAYGNGGGSYAFHNRWFGSAGNWVPFGLSSITRGSVRAYLMDSGDPAVPGGAMGFYINADGLKANPPAMFRHRQKAVTTYLDGHSELVDSPRLEQGLQAIE